MVDFETVCKISDTGSIFICMRDNYDFVSSVDELRRELVDMTFDTSWLWKEEVADHSYIVRHLDNKYNDYC